MNMLSPCCEVVYIYMRVGDMRIAEPSCFGVAAGRCGPRGGGLQSQRLTIDSNKVLSRKQTMGEKGPAGAYGGCLLVSKQSMAHSDLGKASEEPGNI